jgi:hypothetical protein
MTTPANAADKRRMRKAWAHENRADGKDEWLTPRWITDALGPFDLDPCAPIVRPWDTAAQHFTIHNNGLLNEWRGFVWCNPPYNNVRVWMQRMAAHNNGIALTFARTDTAMFHDCIFGRATLLLFLRGRLSFHHVDGSKGGTAGAASVLIAYGQEAARRLRSPEMRCKGWLT